MACSFQRNSLNYEISLTRRASILMSAAHSMEDQNHHKQKKHILFLDGECLFCQKSARLLNRWDRSSVIYFSTLQGETASMLPDDWRTVVDPTGKPSGTAVLIENSGSSTERRWREADAILRALSLTHRLLSIFWIFHYTPGFLKNGIYRCIARNRHRLSWRKRSCPLPDQQFKDQFLP